MASPHPSDSDSDLSQSEKQCNVETYVDQTNRLLNVLDASNNILHDLRQFNKGEWVVRYPKIHKSNSENDNAPGLLRSLSFADDPNSRSDVLLTPKKNGMTYFITLAPTADTQANGGTGLQPKDEALTTPNEDFRILRLDLQLGTYSSSTSPTALMSQLEKSSIANLIDERIIAAIDRIGKLRQRVVDTSSKVLVTGDLNAGKSTFVNALLRREVMPIDQQPCTTAFCEVHDAAENDGKEEVHVLNDFAGYSLNDESTFTRAKVEDLGKIFDTHDGKSQPVLKVYLSDTRGPSESLLSNGVVDISLIDAPGLNRDSIKTTALFARQDEIDVVVFVVSAENHFTLSSKEFLVNASKDKAYLFIVVNKFHHIKNKEKCRQQVYEQVKEFSPQTYEDKEELVHFVDSASALEPRLASHEFDDMESALRSFVLAKRSKSKLQPASTFLQNLLADINLLVSANAVVAGEEREGAKAHLEMIKPMTQQLAAVKETLDEELEAIENDGSMSAAGKAKKMLEDALDSVGQGKLPVSKPSVTMPSYPGLLGIFDYARDVKRAFLSSLDAAVEEAEDEARRTTSSGVTGIADVAESYLPKGVERNKRVFIPGAMFKSKKGRRGIVVAGGLSGLGIGLARSDDLLETTLADICDIHHHLWAQFSDSDSKDDEDALPLSVLGVISVTAGALTMVGGQAMGLRGMVEGALWIGDLATNENSRKWVAPIVGAGVIGYTAYLVLDLPNSIPRTVGRRTRRSILASGKVRGAWAEEHAERVRRETRKVLGIASYDLKKRFRDALDDRVKECSRCEETVKRAEKAEAHFEAVLIRTEAARAELKVT